MKKIMIHLFFILIFLSGCSEKPSVFSKKIEKDKGSLSVINSSAFLGTVTIDNTLDHEVFVKATGGLDLLNLNVALVTTDDFSFAGGSYPGIGGTCRTTLKSGDVCKMVVRFQPTKVSSQVAQFIFSYTDTLETGTYRYLLTADSHPILTFEYGSSYDFGNKFVGSSTDLRIKITNSGRVTAENIIINNMSLPFSFKGGSYPGSGGTCANSLVPGETCNIIINYSPTAKGQHLQEIVLNYLNNGRTEANTLNLLAWGFTQAALSIAAADGDSFGTVASGYSATKIYTVTHSSGDVAANLLSVSGLTSPFSRTGGTCGSTLTIDQHSCTINVSINEPSSADWNSAFNFSYFNGIQTVTINKTVTASTRLKPTLSFSVSGTLDFGAVKRNTSGTAIITVTFASGEIPATNLNFSTLATPFSYDGGTCTTSLSTGSCTRIVKFSPTGNYKPPVTLPSLQISYEDTLGTVNALAISLKASSDALLTLSPSGSFGSAVTGTTIERIITISNNSGVSATSIIPRSLSTGFQFKGGSFPGTGGTCSATLAPAASGTSSSSCTIVLQFSPTLEQIYSGSLIFDYDNGVESTTASHTLSGTGAPAAMLIAENKNYPTTGLNSQAPAATLVKITNTGSVTATSLSPSIPSGFMLSTLTVPAYNLCNTTLSGGNSCYLNILFTPTIAKNYSETATMNYNNGAGATSTTFTLSGIAENRAELYLSRYNLMSFSNPYIGNFERQTIQIGHGGGATYATDITVLSTSADFIVESSTCGSSMFNAETCTITVKFAPTASGVRTGTLNVNYKVGGIDMIESRALSGTGRTPALLSFTPVSWDFAAVATNTTIEKTITITKSGSPNLYGFSVSSSITGSGFQFKGGTFPGTDGTCPNNSSSTTYSTCTIVVTFTPTALATYNSQVRLTYNNGDVSYTSSIPLSGTGKSKLTFTQGTYNFGQVIQSSSSERVITVQNPGSTDFNNLLATSLSVPYAFKGGTYPGTGGSCGTSLVAGQSCSLVVLFSPTTTGVQSQSLVFTYNDGHINNAQSTATLTGEGIAQAIISVSDGNPFNFGTTNINGSINKTFILTNAGSVAGTSITLNFTSVFNLIGGTCSTTLNAGSICTIVVTFSPVAAITYNGVMTLNYHDGIRTQTELKDLQGTGSTSLNKDYYLSLIPLKSFSDLELESWKEKQSYTNAAYKKFANEESRISVFIDKKIIYSGSSMSGPRMRFNIYNNFDQFSLQGPATIFLKNNRFLSGIYKLDEDQWMLEGYTIYHLKTGQTIEQWHKSRVLER